MGAFDDPRTLLTEEQWEQVETLTHSLSAEQALWLSGYLAGIGAAARSAVETAPSQIGNESLLTRERARTLTILYGTETENSARLAKRLAEAGRASGLAPKLLDMGRYKPRQLKDEKDLLIVVSTHGDGDPPQPAAELFEYVESQKAPRLPELRFAVLALGDSSYERFCEAGKRLDRRLQELGATPILPRVDCDVDYDEAASHWTSSVLERLSADAADAKTQATGSTSVSVATAIPAAGSAAPISDKNHTVLATVVENLVLTGRGSSKETRHVELELADAALRYEPGDSIGFVPRNDTRVVEALLQATGLAAGAPVKLKDRTTTASEALEHDFEITIATPRFLTHWSKLSASAELATLCADEARSQRTAFLRNHHVVDIVRRFPVPGIDAQTLVAGLRPLQPRLYSIASSLAATPGEAHLTVATVRYQLHDEDRHGVASSHIARSSPADSTLPVYVQRNAQFRLPAAGAPIVMIGAGTGVAPYRAFLQEREARGDSGRAWLVFGERNFATDFLYQTEWQEYLKKGVLDRMTVAFSRDQGHKVYVQDRMRGQARDLYAWLQEGAHVYVCGDAEQLAPAVHQALLAIVAEQGGLNADAAAEYVRGLQRERRYQRDVY